jgi:hypothetical protein
LKYRERLSIVFMRDKGPRRSFSLRFDVFLYIGVFVCCLPFLLAGVSWFAWDVWSENRQLRDDVIRFETDLRNEQANVERLENIEELLREAGTRGGDVFARRLAATGEAPKDEPPPDVPEPTEETPPAEEAPAAAAAAGEAPKAGETPADSGQGAFEVVDTGYVNVENVQIRALRGGKMRIALDIRNPDARKSISGKVQATLLRSDGSQGKIEFVPSDLGEFRINRFKRTVIPAFLPGETELVNAQVIVEVLGANGSVAYRNVFPVER